MRFDDDLPKQPEGKESGNALFALQSMRELIVEWAHARNIIKGSTMKDQFIKLVSEFGELSGNAEQLRYEENQEQVEVVKFKLQDDIGDNIVVLAILAAMHDLDIDDIQWAFGGGDNAVGFFASDTLPKGSLDDCLSQLGSSYGRLGDAILKRDKPGVYVAISLSVLVLTNAAQCIGSSLIECINRAYDDIKDRKGVMYNGVFIKESDARYQSAVDSLKALDSGKAVASIDIRQFEIHDANWPTVSKFSALGVVNEIEFTEEEFLEFIQLPIDGVMVLGKSLTIKRVS